MWSVFGSGAVAAVVFFVVLGVYQLLWIVIILKSNNRYLLVMGIPGNVVSIVIYFVSLSGVTILGVPPQNGGTFALLIKALETIYVITCLYLLKAKAL